MSIELVNVSDIRIGNSGRPTGEKYSKYKTVLKKHIPWFKENIEESKDGYIRTKIEDIAKEMEMSSKHDVSIFLGVRYILFNHGIWVEKGQTKAGEGILKMRFKLPGDKLPVKEDRKDKDLKDKDLKKEK